MFVYLMALSATPVDETVCTALANKYEYASKSLAMLFAEVAPGEYPSVKIAREARETNIRQEARDNLELMKANSCKLPTATPSANGYVAQAFKCQIDIINNQTAMLGGKRLPFPATCEPKEWTREQVVP